MRAMLGRQARARGSSTPIHFAGNLHDACSAHSLTGQACFGSVLASEGICIHVTVPYNAQLLTSVIDVIRLWVF